jgi:hypothetical protein
MIRKLTPEIEHAILAYIRNGAYPHVAAAAAGVTEATWYDWLARGRRARAQQPYKALPREGRAGADDRAHPGGYAYELFFSSVGLESCKRC